MQLMHLSTCRLHSAFWYYGCSYGMNGYDMSADGFHSYAESQISVVNDCVASGKSMRECARQYYGTAEQAIKGMYAAFAPDWMSIYPSEQIHWIRMEDYMVAPTKHIQVSELHPLICMHICPTNHRQYLITFTYSGIPAPDNEWHNMQSLLEWLEVELPDAATMEKLEDKHLVRNRGHANNPKIPGCEIERPVMRDDTKKMLEDFYTPWNEMLNKQLGREMWQYL